MTASIETLGWPLAFALAQEQIPPQAHAPVAADGVQTVRVLGRALTGMQKHALVAVGGRYAWSFLCDEGPYLNGTDLAPFPLAFFAAGGALLLAAALAARLKTAGLPADTIRALEIDTFYRMEGSAIRGTMTAHARAPVMRLRGPAGLNTDRLHGLLLEALLASPVGALWREAHHSRFSVRLNGESLFGEAAEMRMSDVPADPAALLADLRPQTRVEHAVPLIVKSRAAEKLFGVEGGAGSSLAAEQTRGLHVRAILKPRADGLARVRTQLFKPIGSIFTFQGRFTEEASEETAPDGLTYLAAGIAFCFLTQLGRYAQIVKLPLAHSALTQDMAFRLADPQTGYPAASGPIVTDVVLAGDLDGAAARRLVRMGAQTCFLHAASATPLKPRIALVSPSD